MPPEPNPQPPIWKREVNFPAAQREQLRQQIIHSPPRRCLCGGLMAATASSGQFVYGVIPLGSTETYRCGQCRAVANVPSIGRLILKTVLAGTFAFGLFGLLLPVRQSPGNFGAGEFLGLGVCALVIGVCVRGVFRGIRIRRERPTTPPTTARFRTDADGSTRDTGTPGKA